MWLEDSTNTPMQALVLQNDPQFLEAAASLELSCLQNLQWKELILVL